MTRIIVFLFAFGVPLLVFAQKKQVPATIFEKNHGILKKQQNENNARNYLALSVGMLLPEGDFRSDFEEELAGYAKTGLHLSVDVAYLFSKNVGVGMSGGYMMNGIQAENYTIDVLQRLPEVTEGSLETGKWTNGYVALGPYVALPEDKITVDLRFLAGIQFTNAPELIYTATYKESPITDTRFGASGRSLVWVVGAGLSYPLPTFYAFSVFLKGEYVGGATALSVEQRTESADFNVVSRDEYKQSVGGFSLGLGVRYEFGY